MKRKQSFHSEWLISAVLMLPLSCLSAEEFQFNWEIVGRELGMEMDAATFAAMQREYAVGRHPYDVFINNLSAGEETVEIYVSETDETTLLAALPARVFQKLSLKREALRELYQLKPETLIYDYESLIPGVSIELDQSTQTVRVEVPQIYEDKRRRTFLAPELWNYGETALIFSYNADVSHRKIADQQDTSAFISTNARVNIGRWRFFANGNIQKQSHEDWTSDIYEKYGETILPTYGAKLRVGEFSSESKYLHGLPIRGFNIFEDSAQVDPLDDRYIPIVTGFANSSAQVTVRQGDRILRKIDVAPGPFEFDDLPIGSDSGNLTVEVKEFSGKTSTYEVPFSSDQKLLKENRLSWSLAAGKYYDGYSSLQPWLGQFSVGYGMPIGGWTLYTGSVQSEYFEHYLLGSAFDFGRVGALAIQFENSRITEGNDRKGNVAEISWKKYFELSESRFDLRFRHTMEGNLGSISEAIAVQSRQYDSDWREAGDFVRDEISFTMSKGVGKWGTVYGTGLWSKSEQGEERRSLSASWSFMLGRCNASVYLQNSHSQGGFAGDSEEWTASFNLTIPWAIFEHPALPEKGSISLSAVTTNHHESSQQVDFSAPFGQNDQWYGNLTLQNSRYSPDTLDGRLDYDSQYGTFGVGASYSEGDTNFSARLAGTVLATSKGVFLSDSAYGNIAVVHVPDGGDGAMLNSRGKSGEWQVISGVSDFVANDLTLNPDSLPPNLTVIGGYAREIVPADGAVLNVEFATFKGYQAVFTIKQPDGTLIPFGGLVSVNDIPISVEPSVTDEAGQAYFSAVPGEGSLTARWREDGKVRSCVAPYLLSNLSSDDFEIHEEKVQCQSAEEVIYTEQVDVTTDIVEDILGLPQETSDHLIK